MALVPNREFNRYGGVLLDGDRVAGFARPGPASEGSGHFIGVQIVNSTVFDAVPAGAFANSVGGIYNALIAAQPGAVRGYLCDAEFWDVGTVEDYWRTSSAFASRGTAASSSAAHAAQVDPSARVTSSILWDDVVIDAGATIDQCIVTDGVRVASGESHRGAILLRGENGTVTVPIGGET
jgi:NDP-sugar pyrophosphorylase family protein